MEITALTPESFRNLAGGRMAVFDLLLARAEGSTQRFYSLSAQIQRERKAYYDILEQTQRGNLDATTTMRLASDPISRAIRPEDVPLPTALAMLVREKLTGQAIPEAAQVGTAMVRSWIEARVSPKLNLAITAAAEHFTAILADRKSVV